MPRKYASIEERIIANTIIMDEYWWNGSYCWIWIGTRTCSRKRGGARYGKIQLRWKRGKRKGKGRTALAHRIAFMTFRRHRLTHRMVVKHGCNNTLCCNPMHLFGGTQKSNMRQMVREGRHRNMYKNAVLELMSWEKLRSANDETVDWGVVYESEQSNRYATVIPIRERVSLQSRPTGTPSFTNGEIEENLKEGVA